MGSIRNVATGETRLLEAECLVGRSSSCALHLGEKYISAQHALLRWSGESWRIRDLGSRNGTYLDGVRLAPGDEHDVSRGSRLAFAKVSEQAWDLLDDGAPEPMVVPLDGDPPILVDGDILALPSSDSPVATLYRQHGVWVLEQEHHSEPLDNKKVFEVDGRSYRFSVHESIRLTSLATGEHAFDIVNSELVFGVSQDEEFVHLEVQCGGRKIDAGSRAHNYLLLTLARRWLADREEGHVVESCGWVSYDELAHDPTMARPNINIHVFRIRKHFARLGFADAARIIERRPRLGQFRIGTTRLRIRRA
jgi:hypothetical protein